MFSSLMFSSLIVTFHDFVTSGREDSRSQASDHHFSSSLRLTGFMSAGDECVGYPVHYCQSIFPKYTRNISREKDKATVVNDPF